MISPGRVDADARALGARRRRELRVVEPEPELGRAEDASLLRGDDADPDVAAFGPRLLAIVDPVVVVDLLEHLGQHALVVAAVVDVPGRRPVRERAGGDQVAPADLDAVEVEVARGHVDEPLEDPVRDLGAEAAVGALLVLVRQHGGQRVLDVLDPVRPDDLGERVPVGAGAELEVGAVVVDARDPQRLELAVVVERERGLVAAVGAAVVVVDDVRAAILDVLHRLADEHREEPGERRHLVHEELRAEAAACGDGHESELARRDLQRAGDQPEEVREVHRVGVDRDDARARVVVADRAVRVHRHPRRARPVELGGDRAVGVGRTPGRPRRRRTCARRRCSCRARRARAASRPRAPRPGRARPAAARRRPRSARRRPRRCSGSRRSRPRRSRRSGAPSRSRSCPARSGRRRTTAAAPRARRRPCR